MQGMRAEIVDGVDRPLGNHPPKIGIDLDRLARLEVGKIFVANR
jgi:hypothetical protein